MIIKLIDQIYLLVERRTQQQVILVGLFDHETLLINEWTDLSDFCEYFQSFTRNHLAMGEKYFIKGIDFELHKQKNTVVLAMYCQGRWYYFSKLEASQVLHKMNRVLGRCDLLYQAE